MKARDRKSDARTMRMLPVVERIARKVARRLPKGIDVGDLVGAGHVGLLSAVSRGAQLDESSFEAYAVTRIHGEIIDELRRMDRLSRRERARVRKMDRAQAEMRQQTGRSVPPSAVGSQTGWTAEQCAEAQLLRLAGSAASLSAFGTDEPLDTRGVSIDDTVDAVRRFRRVRRAASALPDRLHHVLVLYEQGETLKNIGVRLGVTEARVCQLRKQAIDILREGSERSSLAPPGHAA